MIPLRVVADASRKGAARASAALSKLLGRRIEVAVERVALVPYSSIPEFVGGRKALLAFAITRVKSGIRGIAFLAISMKSAREIVSSMTASLGVEGVEGVDVFEELGNIIIGNFLGGIADFIGEFMPYEKPIVVVDAAGAVLDGLIAEMAEAHDEVFICNVRFSGLGLEKALLAIISEGAALADA